jgi:hypothetical protein
MQNRVFFPQAALDQWIVQGAIDLQDNELTILGEGRRYRMAEAVRVLREVSGGEDPNELVGRVKAKGYLAQLGAEIMQDSMLVADAAYDVEPGWVGIPIGTFAEHLSSAARPGASKTDEELLANFLAKSP